MRYFVKGEFIEPGALLPQEQFVQMLENIIIPSLEAVAKLESENKILAAGLLTGARAGVFILEAQSNEEVTELLQNLPFWGLLKWKVVPLDSFENRANQERQNLVERLKSGK